MMPSVLPVSAITTELLLQVFDLPVSFHRCLIPLTGSVTAALMLSQAIAITQGIDPAAEGWFVRSREEWNLETGLSRWELESARRTLRDAGFLEERRAGLPAKLYYRVCTDRVWIALREQAQRAASRNRCPAAREAEV
jgi:hypothetical protein